MIGFLAPPLTCFCACSGCGWIGLTVIAARKVLQESLQEDEAEEDEDEQRYLNLNEEEGDVWDDDSAYIEMLAKEVCTRRLLPSFASPPLECVAKLIERSRVNACAREQSEKSTTRMEPHRTRRRKTTSRKNSVSSPRWTPLTPT